jgi:hypothetical protein
MMIDFIIRIKIYMINTVISESQRSENPYPQKNSIANFRLTSDFSEFSVSDYKVKQNQRN